MHEGVFLRAVVRPSLAVLATGAGRPRLRSPAAECLLLAIAGRETDFGRHRFQLDRTTRRPRPDLARGFYQFERRGGTAAVLAHPATARLARDALAAIALIDRGVEADGELVGRVYDALACSELAMTILARLLLWPDPAPLPPVDVRAAAGAYAYYDRTWRPGREHGLAKFEPFWRRAVLACLEHPPEG